ncbi:protein disulfide-isomerase [Erpetoichthys calabaricus]|uniref:protein disulfide-isomerase n=1 Tax=Erpetoichthys calabaricus TaxID=27687 RepID=A0A8C4T644_ERPCA|nr:protein disulfide-isomerase [Erpetoichthys calabaricus]
MKVLSFSVVAAVCCVIAATTNETEKDPAEKSVKTKKAKKVKIKEENGILMLKGKNYVQAIDQHKRLLVYFHAPMSGDSQTLLLEFKSAATLMKNDSSKIHFGMVDVSQEKSLAKELNVTSFPALWFYTEDEESPTVCPALRTASSIVTWLQRRTGPSATLIKDGSHAETFLKSGNVVVLGFFQDLEDAEVQIFYEAAKDIPDLPFGVTKNKIVFNKYGITGDTVLLSKKKEKNPFLYEVSNETSKKDLIRFVRVNEMDLVTEYTRASSGKIFDALVTSHMLLFTNKSAEDFGVIYENFEAIAAEFKGKILCVFVNTDEPRNGRIFEHFRVRDVDCPAVRIIDLTTSVQYQMQADEVSIDNVKKFAEDFLGGKAKPKLESEPIPEDWDKHPVKELVGRNFERVAFNDERNVFVMFYAPWSEECQKLFPILEKLGKVYEHHESVVIAKIDSTANDVHTVLLERYPMFKFFPATYVEKIVPYQEEKTLEAFVHFIEKQLKELQEEKEKEKETKESKHSDEKLKEEL